MKQVATGAMSGGAPSIGAALGSSPHEAANSARKISFFIGSLLSVTRHGSFGLRAAVGGWFEGGDQAALARPLDLHRARWDQLGLDRHVEDVERRGRTRRRIGVA